MSSCENFHQRGKDKIEFQSRPRMTRVESAYLLKSTKLWDTLKKGMSMAEIITNFK